MDSNDQKNKVKAFHILDFPDSIYITLKEEYRKRLFGNLYKKYGSKRATARKLGIDLSTIRAYENGSHKWSKTKYPSSIPIRIIKKVTSLDNQRELEKNVVSIRSKSGLKILNPTLPIKECPELYSIMAHILGDGNASKGNTPTTQILVQN
ncbi:MAG: hypothetical protein QF824_03605 [Candidatus Woesearchaeota archaeon]|jgi:hypothetical protein|nr:hypothetical protein [Candidatus Woesearchaeota archaeon]|tara:strand:+ start:301 stop:753 length:453 start_codon:yes stop_codon:yes gene_type:complete